MRLRSNENMKSSKMLEEPTLDLSMKERSSSCSVKFMEVGFKDHSKRAAKVIRPF